MEQAGTGELRRIVAKGRRFKHTHIKEGEKESGDKMVQDMPPVGGYEAVQYKVGCALSILLFFFLFFWSWGALGFAWGRVQWLGGRLDEAGGWGS